MKSPWLLLLLIGSASALQSVRSPSTSEGGAPRVGSRSLQDGITVYTDKDKWEAAMASAGFTVVENDLSPLVEGEQDGEILLPEEATTDVGLFDINLDDNSLENWIWKYKSNIAYEGYYSSSNGIKFENFEGGVACGFAGTWKQYEWKQSEIDDDDDLLLSQNMFEKADRDIIIEVNGDELSISDILDYKDTFIGIVVTEGFDSIDFLPPEKKVMFELFDIFLSVECSTSTKPSNVPSIAPTSNPSQVPSTTTMPSLSHAPSATPSTSAPSASPSTSAPSASPSTSGPSSTPTTSAPTLSPVSSSPTESPLGIEDLVNAILVKLLTEFFDALVDLFG